MTNKPCELGQTEIILQNKNLHHPKPRANTLTNTKKTQPANDLQMTNKMKASPTTRSCTRCERVDGARKRFRPVPHDRPRLREECDPYRDPGPRAFPGVRTGVPHQLWLQRSRLRAVQGRRRGGQGKLSLVRLLTKLNPRIIDAALKEDKLGQRRDTLRYGVGWRANRSGGNPVGMNISSNMLLF